MKSMGFQTPANIPYRVIGSPLYLDQKQIILYGLGQFAVGDLLLFAFYILQAILNINITLKRIK
jgi:hypothetical protein